MCRFGLPRAIVSNNGTHFTSDMVIGIFLDLEVHIKFVYILHLHANGKKESANKVIMKGLKKKLNDAKGLWAELLYKILWSYHFTPHSTTKQTLVYMVYGADVVLAVEIDTPSWQCSHFNQEVSHEGL